MLDVMDKHFQEELHLSLSQSASVQFAHWMGYFISPYRGLAGRRAGLQRGIIAGLLLVAVGGFWFIPATKIAAFLGLPPRRLRVALRPDLPRDRWPILHHGARAVRYAATRINAASPATASAGIFGPIAGSMFFYGTDAAGRAPAPRLFGSHTRALRWWSSSWQCLLLRPGPRRQGRKRRITTSRTRDNDGGKATAPLSGR